MIVGNEVRVIHLNPKTLPLLRYYHSQDEQAKSRKTHAINALKSTSNKRDGSPDTHSQGKPKDVTGSETHDAVALGHSRYPDTHSPTFLQGAGGIRVRSRANKVVRGLDLSRLIFNPLLHPQTEKYIKEAYYHSI
jgi:hypothetical protein